MTSCSTKAPPPPQAALSIRLVAVFFSTAMLLVVAASAILYTATVAALNQADDQVVDKRAAAIADILNEPAINEALLAHEINEDNQGPRQIFIRVMTPAAGAAQETEGMSDYLPAGILPNPENAALGAPVRATVTTKKGQTFRTASRRVRVAGAGGAAFAILQVATDTTLDENALALFRGILLAVVGGAFPLAAALSWYIVKRELKPLARITAATQDIDADTIGRRLSLETLPDELHRLARQFNLMLDRLEASWEDLKHYADTIAHEMRTPINRMRLNSEIALAKAETEDELREVVHSNLAECERLTRLLNGLLFLARADNHQAAILPERFSPASQLAVVKEFYEDDATSAGVTLKCEARPECCEIVADRELFKQALANLVSNAIRHTPKGGSVILSCSSTLHEILVQVEDTGSGIAPEVGARIFDRFYRGGGAATQDSRAGLGLAITKNIMKLHGGRITMDSAPGRGTRMTLAFPLRGNMLPGPAAVSGIGETGT
ncbi:MAG TPA: heavy metal sensor histidine kinase [Hyphomicrobium sp.]|nr:heavy metal sensor histidine kinase [Hyphomicrobium sp.]